MVLRILNCSDHFWSWGSLHARSPFWAQASARCTYQMTFIEIMMMMISIDMIIIIKLTTTRLLQGALITYQKTLIEIITIIFRPLHHNKSHSYRETLIVVGWKLSSWIVITALLSSVITLEITMMMISIDMTIVIKLTTIRLMHNTHIGWPSLHSSDQGGTKSSEFKIKVTLY